MPNSPRFDELMMHFSQAGSAGKKGKQAAAGVGKAAVGTPRVEVKKEEGKVSDAEVAGSKGGIDQDDMGRKESEAEENEEEDEEDAEEENDEDDEEEDEEEDAEDDNDDNGDNSAQMNEQEEAGEQDRIPNTSNTAGHSRDILPSFPSSETQSSFHDDKPSISNHDVKPSPKALKTRAIDKPGPFSKLADDVILEIAQFLIADEAYSSAVSVLGTCQRTKHVLRPLLKKTKKRIVLDLDDLRWVSRKTWKNIRIITCNSSSALPFLVNSKPTKEHRKEVRNDLIDLQPWAIVHKGEPSDSVLALQENFFPSVKVIRVNTDLAIHELEYLATDVDLDKTGFVADKLDDMIEALRKRSLAKPMGQPHLRVRYHHRYSTDLQQDFPGQMFSRWSATHWNKSVVVDKASYGITQLEKMENDFKDWLDEIEHSVSLPENTGFETISLDLYFQPRPSAMGLFYSVDDEFPAAYDILSEYAEDVAEKWLEATTFKPLAELKIQFFVLHGEFLDRDELRPVFKTHKAKKFDGSVKTRELFIDDVDFARCVKNGGCSRCKARPV